MSNWDDIEIFENRLHRNLLAYITISKNNFFVLSKGFISREEKNIGVKRYVIFAYSKNNNAIVFKFVSDEMAGGFKLTYKRNKNEMQNACANLDKFFKYHDLAIENIKGRYIPKLEEINNNGNFWVISLNKKLGE